MGSQVLGFTIEIANEAFVLGQPIIITARLTNVSSEPIALYRTEDFLHLYLSSDGKQFDRFGHEEISGKRKHKKEALRAGETCEFHTVLLRGSLHVEGTMGRFVAVPEPGVYSVRAEYGADKGITLESNVIRFRVRRPEKVDAEVWQMLRDEDAATYEDYSYFLKYGSPRREDTESRRKILEKFYQIVEAYPESAYASILRDALIRHFEWRAKGRVGPSLSEEEKAWYESLRLQH
jgi:hypothetical protein